MTWRADAGYATPGDWVRLGQGVFRNIFLAGETLTFPVVGSGTVATWEVIDHTGLTVGTGGPVTFTNGQSWTLPVTNPGPGWYRVLFRRGSTVTGWGTSQGGGMFLITRSVAGMPPRPPTSLGGVGTYNDGTVYWATLTGPVRLDADITDPTATDVGLQNGVGQYGTYYAPYDTSRAKPLLLAFPNGTDTTDPATATATIATIAAKYPAITHFEGANEPGGVPDSGFVPIQQRFHDNVKAARPSAPVCGPAPVGIGGAAQTKLRDFLSAGGGRYIDVWSFHTYNAHMGDLLTGRRSWDAFQALLTEFGQWGKPRINSEAGGFFGAEYGAGQPLRQACRTLLDLFLNEQYGVPKEFWSYYYTNSRGFLDYPSFMENDGPLAYPIVACLLTHSQELLGAAFEARLDFGTVDNDHLIGSSHRRGDGTGVVALMSAGQDSTSVTFQIAGGSPASLATVTAFGRASSITVSGGLAAVTVGTLPVYVELPAGVTAVPVERRMPNRVGAATAAITGGAFASGDPQQVVSGSWRNALYYDAGNNGDSRSVFESALTPSAGSPVDFTVTFPTTVLDTVVVHCPPAWQADLSVIRDADIQVQAGGAWQTVGTIGYQPRVEQFSSTSSDGYNGYAETWDADVHRFEVTFGRVQATGIRIHVREVSAGGSPTVNTSRAFGQTDSTGATIYAGFGTDTPRLALQRVAAYDSVLVGVGKYVAVL